MKIFTLLLVILFCYLSGFGPGMYGEEPIPLPAEGKIDHTIPENIAKAALNAYKAKDIKTLMILSRPDIADRIKKMIKLGKLEEINKRSFDETKWRYKSVTAWDGKLHEMKKRGNKIRIRYGYIGAEEVAVVELITENEKWYFEDLKSPNRQSWATWGK